VPAPQADWARRRRGNRGLSASHFQAKLIGHTEDIGLLQRGSNRLTFRRCFFDMLSKGLLHSALIDDM
jgi:hypothetical protein